MRSVEVAIELEQIRNLNKPERIAVTEHARRRLAERGITISDILRCIETGEIIKQYEDDRPFPSCLILGVSQKNEYIHIVINHDGMWIYLITAYYPDSEVWEFDFKRKKRDSI